MSIVYLNGKYIDRDQAKVDVLDRGFIFADGVYEVIPVYQHHPFHLEEHLIRLENSCQGIELTNSLSKSDWTKIFSTLLKQFSTGDYAIYLQITRGAAPVRDHTFPIADIKPTVYAQVTPLAKLSAAQLAHGLSAITTEDVRWKLCQLKTIALLPNILAREKAKRAGADEAIFIRDGQLTEGSVTNVFIVKNDIIKTTPLDGRILPGVTRQVILHLADKHNMPYQETSISETELHQADEIWISSSSKEVAPVTKLDGKKVADGKVGPVWEKMFGYFQKHKAEFKDFKSPL